MKCIDEVINGYLRNIKYSEIKYDNLRIKYDQNCDEFI